MICSLPCSLSLLQWIARASSFGAHSQDSFCEAWWKPRKRSTTPKMQVEGRPLLYQLHHFIICIYDIYYNLIRRCCKARAILIVATDRQRKLYMLLLWIAFLKAFKTQAAANKTFFCLPGCQYRTSLSWLRRKMPSIVSRLRALRCECGKPLFWCFL